MIRLVAILLFLLLFLAVSVPVQLALWLISMIPGAEPGVRLISLEIVKWGFRVINGIAGVRLTVKGRERVPAGEPVLYVGNHRSDFDTVIIYSIMNGPTGFIAKKEMLLVPVLATWMKFLYCLFLDRDDMAKGMQMILDAVANIGRGVSYVIFPEGTRNKTQEDLLPFHKGSFKIAQRSGCAIVPFSLNNTRRIYEEHPFKVCPSDVVMEFGEPIRWNELSRDEQRNIDRVVRDRVGDMYRNNKEPA